MIEIINETDGITAKILRIIKKAKSEVHIVSPFLQSWDRLEDALDYTLGKDNIEVNIITRNKEGDSTSQIQSPFDRCDIHILPSIHSKIYCNEREALITSMNMYGHSAKNNYEVGVYFPPGVKQLTDIKENIEYLIDRAEPYLSPDKVEKKNGSKEELSKERFTVISKGYKWTKVETPKGYVNKILNDYAPDLVEGTEYEAFVKKHWKKTKWGTNVEFTDIQDLRIIGDERHGFCIICGDEIQFDPEKPLCKPCYYDKKEYRGNIFGKYCHKCGEYRPDITDAKALCLECYKEESG